ncbi:MAG: PHP domain-containing protein, partial [Candidatus Methanoplasma sp.]|nr:PHP domain-containing protein [Candidatus Methanoplasma sp.]
MKADLHIHSNFSNDGKSTVEEIIAEAERKGLGCIAITDHNSFEAYGLAKDNGKVIVIPGTEVSSKDGHILAYGIDRNIPRGMTIKETI